MATDPGPLCEDVPVIPPLFPELWFNRAILF